MSFSENFINIFDAMGKQLGIAIDWTDKNIMPYIEQLCDRVVNYEMFTSIAWSVFMIIIVIIGVILLRIGIKHMNKPDRKYYDDEYVPYIIVGTIAIIMATIFTIVEIGDIITCFTLPEKTIIEFITRYK